MKLMLSDSPSGFVTTNVTVPAESVAGVVTASSVSESEVTVTVCPASITVAPVWKPVPAMRTVCPPRMEPVSGVTESTWGGAR